MRKIFDKLRENGHILVLSTGRAIPAPGVTLKEIDFENVISSAGNVTMGKMKNTLIDTRVSCQKIERFQKKSLMLRWNILKVLKIEREK